MLKQGGESSLRTIPQQLNIDLNSDRVREGLSETRVTRGSDKVPKMINRQQQTGLTTVLKKDGLIEKIVALRMRRSPSPTARSGGNGGRQVKWPLMPPE